MPDALWQGYRDYCVLLEKGLRRKALEALNGFVRAMASSPSGERRAFTEWLVPWALKSPNVEQLIPHSLMKEAIRPTLDEWIATSPEEARLHYWRGRLTHSFDDLQTALRLNSGHAEARWQMIGRILNDVDYATHELPEGFIGDPEDVLEKIREAESLLDESLGEQRLAMLREEIEEYRGLTLAYIASRRPS